jgi:hypothetical protein
MRLRFDINIASRPLSDLIFPRPVGQTAGVNMQLKRMLRDRRAHWYTAVFCVPNET